MGFAGAFAMAAESELSVRGTSKVLVNSVAVSEEQAVKLSTVASARVADKYAVGFRTGKGESAVGVSWNSISPSTLSTNRASGQSRRLSPPPGDSGF